MTSAFTLNVMLSVLEENHGMLNGAGMITFGSFTSQVSGAV